MYLKKIYLACYRNLKQQEVEFIPELNFVIGKNAQGKTNLLEAIYLLSNGKSFRNNKIKEFINWDLEEAYLRANLLNNISNHVIELSIKGSVRKFTLDNNPIHSLVDYLGTIKTVCFTPEDLNLIKGQPALRRAFIDRHITDLTPDFLTNLVKYNKATKSKSLLLKEKNQSFDLIKPWNAIMADHAAVIIRKRNQFIKNLQIKANQIYSKFAKTDGEIELSWKNSIESENISEIFLNLNSAFEKEKILKQCLYGPHRDDLLIFLNSKQASKFASQGQTRSIALALKFAVVELIEEKFKESPIILLDDLDSELDKSRAEDLHKLLFSEKRQIFVSGTEMRDLVWSNKRRVLQIEGGKVML